MNAADLSTAPVKDGDLARLMQALGSQAKAASALMAKAPASLKNQALVQLAGLLREHFAALQTANQRDLSRAAAAGRSSSWPDCFASTSPHFKRPTNAI